MIFSLDVRRARKGDCLLLHYGTAAEPALALIDGGPSRVYGPHLKPRLIEIREARDIADDRPLPIDLLMVSHVDDDHIQGILDLTRELREEPGVPLVRIRRLWHNSFDEVIGNDPEELTSSLAAQFGPASLGGGLPSDATVDSAEEDQEVVGSTLRVIASIPQGHRLRLDAEALDLSLNPEFDGKLILAAEDAIDLTDDLSFTVVGPMQPEVQALQRDHDKWLEQLEEEGLTPEEALAAFVDKSVPNLSSLVLLVESGDKSILLTGDARGDKILAGLESIGVIEEDGKLNVDVLKVPHHGSANNLTRGFFERITADHYVFSGNGEHGNPEREALKMLLSARPTAKFAIHLTYPIDEIDVEREKDWEKEQARERRANEKRAEEGRPLKPVRANWSHQSNSIAAFLEANPLRPGQTLHIVPETNAHVIDLLDPLGF
jgi:hypothetical protein